MRTPEGWSLSTYHEEMMYEQILQARRTNELLEQLLEAHKSTPAPEPTIEPTVEPTAEPKKKGKKVEVTEDATTGNDSSGE